MKSLFLMISLIFVVFLVGCRSEETVTTGNISATGMQPGWSGGGSKVGLEAPSLKFVDSKGKTRSIDSRAGWVTVMAFVEAEGNECCLLSPALTTMANTLWDQPVRFLQISEPKTACPHSGEDFMETSHVESLHLMSLCDSAHRAHRAYGQPASGTVFIIGGEGRVAEVTTLDKLSASTDKVKQLAAKAKESQLSPYEQVYSN